MLITQLQPQATNPDRINIFIDGHFSLGVDGLIVLKMGLRVNQELTAEQLQQLQQEESLQQSVERAINYLSYRPHSREEVKRYLRGKKTVPEVIDATIERLEQLELINDHAFASFWIDSRERFSPKGANAVKNELRMKGVQRDVVDELVNDEQDDERALVAGRKKALSLLNQPGIDYNLFRTRLGPFLQRRGFSYDVTKRTVRSLWEELKNEEAEEDF